MALPRPRPFEGTVMSEPMTSPESNRILRASIWVAIGAMIAAALVCVMWVLMGHDNGIVGRAFLTILLLAGFAGVAILETNLAAHRPAWYALASMIAWVLILLLGAFLIWMPTSGYFGAGIERFFTFVLIALIIQGAVLHARLYLRAFARHQTTFTTIVAYVTVGLVAILTVMLVLPLMTQEFADYRPIYWRVVVALAILAAVGTALVPLINALFAPKKARPALPTAYSSPRPDAAPRPWPTYADGATPLPFLPDGTPDWNAYYAGYPTPAQAMVDAGAQLPRIPAQLPPLVPSVPPVSPPAGPPAPPSEAAGYQGYPPAPPVPPLPPQRAGE